MAEQKEPLECKEGYEAMLFLERLESLKEELEELGLRGIDDIERKIAECNLKLDKLEEEVQ